MSSKAWLVQCPSDHPLPFIVLMDWFEQTAKAQWFVGVNWIVWSEIAPPEFEMDKAFTIAFTTEGITCMETFPKDLINTGSLKRLDNMMNPFWHSEKEFDKWLTKKVKVFTEPQQVLNFIKILEQEKKNGMSN